MPRLLHTLLLLSLLAAAGCTGIARKVGPIEIEQVERLGSSGVEVTILVPNHSGRNLKIESAEILFELDDSPLARAELRSAIIVKRHTENRLTTRWRLTSEDPAGLMILEKRLRMQQTEGVTLDYRARVKCGMVKKTFSAERARLSEILCNFAPKEQPQEPDKQTKI